MFNEAQLFTFCYRIRSYDVNVVKNYLKTGVKCVHCSDTRVASFPWRKSFRRALADFLTCDIGEAFLQKLWVMSCKKPYLRLQLLADLNPPFPTKVVWHAWICHISVWVVWHYIIRCSEMCVFFKRIFTVRQRIWGKVIFLHLFVCSQRVYDVTSCLVAWSYVISRECMMSPPSAYGRGGMACPWYWHLVAAPKRAIRILLVCILVLHIFCQVFHLDFNWGSRLAAQNISNTPLTQC